MSVELNIETTWLEDGSSLWKFDRVVVFNYVINTTARELHTVLPQLISERFATDIGLSDGDDYVCVDAYISQHRETYNPFPSSRPHEQKGRTTYRIRSEEHFMMMKLYYDTNP